MRVAAFILDQSWELLFTYLRILNVKILKVRVLLHRSRILTSTCTISTSAPLSFRAPSPMVMPRGRLRKIGKSYERKREGCRYGVYIRSVAVAVAVRTGALRAIKPRTGNRPSVASRRFPRFLLSASSCRSCKSSTAKRWWRGESRKDNVRILFR